MPQMSLQDRKQTADAKVELSLVAEVNRLHAELCGLARTSLQTAIRIGELLTEQKAQLKHGEWLPWVKDNCQFKLTSAAKYIALFREREKFSAAENLGVDEAYRLLSQPAEEPECETPPTPEPKKDEPQSFSFEEPDPTERATPSIQQIEQPLVDAPKPKRNAACISLDEFNALSAKDRIDRLTVKPGFTAVFNYQDNDNIEWARWSWNPVTGCNHGCDYCYARDIAERFRGDAFPFGFAPAIYPERLIAPSHTKPKHNDDWSDVDQMGHRNVFTCSMADLFGKWVPREWIEAVLEQAHANKQWNFLFLSKFPQRMQEFEFPDNAWVGTSVDKQGAVARAERAFEKINAKVKWLSCEPMLERLTFNSLEMFNWVVVGGSSRSTQTPEFHPPFEWILHLHNQARDAKSKLYMKSNLFGDGSRVREYPV